jgi:signal transduction histidine kinase
MDQLKFSTPVTFHSKQLYNDITRIFDFIPYGIALFDQCKQIVYYNHILRELLGITFRDCISDVVLNLSSSGPSLNQEHPKFPNVMTLMDSLKDEGDEQSAEFNYQQNYIWVKAKLIRIHDEMKYILTFSNITTQRKYEVLKEINHIKSKIISSISHEIRNPLHNILDSLNSIIPSECNASESSKYIQIATSNANQILYKIDDLLVKRFIRTICIWR